MVNFAHFGLYFGLGALLQSQCEQNVPRNIHVWVERVILKDHRQIAILWFQMTDGSIIQIDLPL